MKTCQPMAGAVRATPVPTAARRLAAQRSPIRASMRVTMARSDAALPYLAPTRTAVVARMRIAARGCSVNAAQRSRLRLPDAISAAVDRPRAGRMPSAAPARAASEAPTAPSTSTRSGSTTRRARPATQIAATASTIQKRSTPAKPAPTNAAPIETAMAEPASCSTLTASAYRAAPIESAPRRLPSATPKAECVVPRCVTIEKSTALMG